jgi:hypothetical protein
MTSRQLRRRHSTPLSPRSVVPARMVSAPAFARRWNERPPRAAVLPAALRWACYTRHANSGQSWGPGTSYIDYAVATGAEEGRWRWAKHVAAETEEGAPLSDHYAIVVERSVNAARPVARRPSTAAIVVTASAAAFAALIAAAIAAAAAAIATIAATIAAVAVARHGAPLPFFS